MEPEKKIYDLLERTSIFAKRIRNYCLGLPKNAANIEYIPQLIRAGSSPGANYIEANETIGDKDFKMKIRTCRRESKEAGYWLKLTITNGSDEMEKERMWWLGESREFVLIFNSIVRGRD